MSILTAIQKIIKNNWFAGISIFLMSMVPLIFANMYFTSKLQILQVFLISNVITSLIWFGVSYIQKFVTRKFPWEKGVGKHLTFEILLLFLYLLVLLSIGFVLFSFYSDLLMGFDTIFRVSFVSFGLTITFSAIYEGRNLFKKWKISLFKMSVYQKESLRIQLESLKQQMDPHFLFNSLNVLSSLIHEKSEVSNEFIDNLSKVYRYLLEHNEKELVMLEEEMNFLDSYLSLLKIRFGNAFVIRKHKLDIVVLRQSYMPPLIVQTLLENVVKHNTMNESSPLVVDIFIADEELVIKNNIQPSKIKQKGLGIGHQNIKNRYQFLCDKKPKFSLEKKCFVVRLPLITVEK